MKTQAEIDESIQILTDDLDGEKSQAKRNRLVKRIVELRSLKVYLEHNPDEQSLEAFKEKLLNRMASFDFTLWRKETPGVWAMEEPAQKQKFRRDFRIKEMNDQLRNIDYLLS